jgi:hypothetical protein
VRLIHVLAALPFLGILGGIAFANRVEPFVFGMPFILFWIVLWVSRGFRASAWTSRCS